MLWSIMARAISAHDKPALTFRSAYGNMQLRFENIKTKMKTIATQSLSELEEFVVYQAAEDAVLPDGERKYQEKLVSDVLTQEASTPKKLKELFDEYKANIELARAKRPPVKA